MTSSPIPKHIWQTYRTSALPAGLSELAATWDQNTEWTRVVFSDEMCIDYLSENHDKVLCEAFRRCSRGDIKADIWRYCIVLDRGGLYVDVDAYCIAPLKVFFTRTYSLLVSRADYEKVQNVIEQYTFAAAPGHPATQKMVDHISQELRQVPAHHYATLGQEFTGVIPWTSQVSSHLSDPTTRVYTPRSGWARHVGVTGNRVTDLRVEELFARVPPYLNKTGSL